MTDSCSTYLHHVSQFLPFQRRSLSPGGANGGNTSNGGPASLRPPSNKSPGSASVASSSNMSDGRRASTPSKAEPDAKKMKKEEVRILSIPLIFLHWSHEYSISTKRGKARRN